MKEIIWDTALSVQIPEIDEDHQKLIELFNQLNQSIKNNDSREYIGALLKELITCTAWHFSHEERLMLKHNYKGLTEHKQEHEELLASVQQLFDKFSNNSTLSDENIEFLEHWLTGHILGTDMEMAEFLGETM